MPSDASPSNRIAVLQAALMLLWLVFLAAVALHGLQPPPPRPASAPAGVFSAERALPHIRALAALPHPLGTAAHDQARDYLLTQLKGMGLSPQAQTVPVVATGWSRPYRAATVSNVWARLPGSNSAGTLLLAAHYDSVPTGPGASDDAAGAAGLLETARALLSKQKTTHLRNDVVFLFTDGEEAGLFGARAFVKPRGEVIALNFEARGSGGPSLMFETGPENGALARHFARAVPQPAASSLFYAVYKILPNDTDFTEFRKAGMRGLNFAFIDHVSDYHTALDNLDRLDARSLQQQGDNMLGLARDLGNTPLKSLVQPDVIYFNVTRSRLAIYPESWAMPLAVCATLLTLVFLAANLRTRQITLSSLLLGFAQILGALALTAGIGALLIPLFAAFAPSPRSALYLDGSVSAGAVLLASGLTLALLLRFARRRRAISSLPHYADNAPASRSVLAGAVLWWLLLTWLTALKLPGGSYLFLWPLGFVLAAHLAAPMQTAKTLSTNAAAYEADRGTQENATEQGQLFAAQENARLPAPMIPAAPGSLFATQMLAVIPAVLLVVPVLSLLFSALAATALPVVALLSALTIGLLYPQCVLVTRLLPGRAQALPTLATLGGAALLGAGSFAMRPSTTHPQFDSLFYAVDADKREAVWASDDLRPDTWTRQFLGRAPERSALPDVFPVSVNRFLHAPAPALPLAPPVVTLLAAQGDSTPLRQGSDAIGNKSAPRALRLRVVSPRHAPLVEISVSGSIVSEAIVEGQSVGGNTESGHAWSLLYFHLPPAGITLTLRVKTASPDAAITVRAIDRSYGMPPFPAGSYTPRPASIISSPATGWYQDTTLVSKTYRF